MRAVPDAVADRGELIALRDGVGHAPYQLVRRLRARSEWRGSSLEELLPSLTIIDPSSFADRLGVRSANGLRRADIRTLSALANLSPLSIGSLPGIGIDSTEEILLAAVREWAGAYLRSAEIPGEGKELHRRDAEVDLLRGLIGRTPDLESDRKLLMRLRDRDDPGTQALIVRFRTADDWRELPLRELLPGLGLVEAPRFSTRLSVRAVNGMGREGVSTLTGLAGMSTTTILELPGVGISTVEEIVGVAIDEWASSYLDQGEVSAFRDRHAKDRVESCGDLTDAFAKIEKAAGFDIFRRRHLETGKTRRSEKSRCRWPFRQHGSLIWSGGCRRCSRG